MLIEFHVLQHHAVANLNRDDSGQPKTAWINGTLRGRVSSQSKKRSLRRPGRAGDGGSGPFADIIGPDRLGLRTKLFPERVGEELRRRKGEEGLDMEEEQIRSVVVACQSIAQKEKKDDGEEKGKQDGKARTGQLIFLHPSEVSEYVDRLLAQREERPDSFDYFLNPATIFGELVRKEAERQGLDDKDGETLAKNAWLILKARWDRLFPKGDGDDEADLPPNDPTAETAARLVERVVQLDLQNDKFLKELCKPLKAPKAKKGEKVDPSERKQAEEDKANEEALLAEAKSAAPKDYGKFQDALLPKGQAATTAADVALFGRMTTSDAFEDVEAACRVAHGISTHEIKMESDYFTAIDDLGTGPAAAHLGETYHTSGVYYFHFVIDFDALVANLFGRVTGETLEQITQRVKDDEPLKQRLAEARILAGRTVRAFVRALADTVPTGKRNSHAADSRPGFVLAEVKPKHLPTSYANAFLEPATAGDVQGVTVSYMTDSVRKLCRLAAHQRRAYEIESTPLVFLGETDLKPFIAAPVSSQPKAEVKPVGEVCGTLSDLTEAVLQAVKFNAAEIKGIFNDRARKEVAE